MDMLLDQVFIKEHLMELVGAREDWHGRKYMNLVKRKFPLLQRRLRRRYTISL